MAVENILSNDNYINKDFQSVYTELVDAVGKLNNKWLIDGEGNESDPGVVLVKLIAAATDKINFNIDRNALENYPETVQTEESARRLFSPVYNMKWYRSAQGTVAIKNEGDTDLYLPPYLMLCSADENVVYTTNQTGTTISAGAVVTDIPVIEGKVKTLTVGGDDCITIDKFIDNKIYLDDHNVAENGVFVEPYDTTGATRELEEKAKKSTLIINGWQMVDNIYVQNWSQGTQDNNNNGRYYQFRIDSYTNRPYLQFVDDLVDKIGGGLRIRYILSSGADGNISSGKLTQVYASDAEYIANQDEVKIANLLPIANGKNPESIESAKRNYFKDVDVCNTLVTLRDYANAIYLANGLVSNCFVCDKTNDVQTFKLIDDGTNLIKGTEDTDLTVFNLKLYGLIPREIGYGVSEDYSQDTKNLIYKSNFDTTFKMISPVSENGEPSSIQYQIDNYIDEVRSVNHEFASIRNANKISMIKDYYTLHIDLLFRQRLSDEQQKEIKNKVYKALLDNLNARAIDFGDRVSYNKVQEIIYSADTRILGASVYGLDDTDFKASVVYWTPYQQVQYSTASESDLADVPGTTGDKIVIKSGSDYKFYQYNGTAWQFLSNSDIPVSATRGYSFPSDVDSNTYTAVYTTDKRWNDEGGYAPDASATEVWCCISKPNQFVDTTVITEVRQIEVTSTDTVTSNEIPVYPSVPIQLDFTSGVCLFKYNTAYYKAELTEYGWKYDETPQFFYADNTSESRIGSFLEEYISSEIDNDGKYDDNFAIDQLTDPKAKFRGELQTEIYAKSVLCGATGIYDSDFKFSPRVQDENPQASDGVKYIEPNLELEIKSPYVLRQNEYIQVLTPEFDTIANYSFYVYMGYYNADNTVQSISVGANQNRELKENETVVFFYRASEDERYSYSAYSGGHGYVICPSKNITLYNLTFCKINTGSQGQSHGECPASLNNLVVASTTATYARQRLTALKSQDSCDIKTVHIENVDAYTFKTNQFDSVSNTYKLDFDSNGYYVLEEGEEFSVYVKDRAGSHILQTIAGAGSIIKGSANTELTSQIINGVQREKEVPEGDEIQYIGTEILQISPEMAVRPVFTATVTIDSSISSITPSNNSQSYDESDYIYRVSISAQQISNEVSDGYIQPKLVSGTAYSGDYLGAILNNIQTVLSNNDWSTDESATWSDDEADITAQIQYINQTKSASGTITPDTEVYFSVACHIKRQESLKLDSEFVKYSTLPIISYKNSGDANYTKIPQTNVSGFDILVRSVLHVNIEEGGSQIIAKPYSENGNTSLQSVVAYGEDGSSPIFDTKSNVTDSDCILSSDTAINALGGKQILPQLTTIYYASQHPKTDAPTDITGGGGTIQYTNSGMTINIEPDEEVSISIPTVVSGNGYIMYGKINGDGQFDISNSSDFLLKTLYGVELDQSVEYESNARFTVVIDKSVVTDNIIKISNASVTNDLSLTFDSELTSYKEKDELYSHAGATNAILVRMGELDTENKYKISSKAVYPIRNPIASASFLQQAHPYNKFTMCQMTDTIWRS